MTFITAKQATTARLNKFLSRSRLATERRLVPLKRMVQARSSQQQKQNQRKVEFRARPTSAASQTYDTLPFCEESGPGRGKVSPARRQPRAKKSKKKPCGLETKKKKLQKQSKGVRQSGLALRAYLESKGSANFVRVWPRARRAGEGRPPSQTWLAAARGLRAGLLQSGAPKSKLAPGQERFG